ncbi:CRISPR-associated endonuclease Cas2 [Atopobiaceae bacterium LCP21S3_F11]
MEAQRILLLCDLPTARRSERKQARLYRELLFAEGFYELQSGVYTRMVESRSSRDIHVRHLSEALPPSGRIRLITLTERQFQQSSLLCGEESNQEVVGSELDIFI